MSWYAIIVWGKSWVWKVEGLNILPGKVMKINIKNENIPIVGGLKLNRKK